MTKLQLKLGYKFSDIKLLKEALTHRSIGVKNNERLEFLGDAVLDLVVGEYLFNRFKNTAEGNLSKLRAALVNEKSFAKIAEKIGIGEALLLSPAEQKNGGRTKPSLLSDALEAVMGAIYLLSGIEKVRDIFVRLLEEQYPNIDLAALTKDFKTKLQEITQAKYGEVPRYELIKATGPDHKKSFVMALFLQGNELARAEASSKKEAEQLAAKMVLQRANI